MQVRVPIKANDNATTLAARILEQEHHLFPEAIRMAAEKRVELGANGTVLLDGKPLAEPILI